MHVADRVATITLNRPERKNPLTFDSYAELVAIFRAAREDESVQAFVITGAGGNFSSGGDVLRDHRAAARSATPRASGLHAHDGRLGQGDARLPAADRRGDRRRLRRRRRHPRHGVRPADRHGAQPRSRSCSTASGSPAATWAPARCCRASSARAAPRNCSSPAACCRREEAERWGFFNRLVEPDAVHGRSAGAGARESPTARLSPTP